MMDDRRHRARLTAASVLMMLIASSALLDSSAAQMEQAFKARLSRVPTNVAMHATIAGIGSATAVLQGAKLTIAGTFEGLRSPAMAARLYRGARTGLRGPALADLSVPQAVHGSINGTVDLTPAAIDALKQGCLYIQVDSEGAPHGNIWGWLLPVTGGQR